MAWSAWAISLAMTPVPGMAQRSCLFSFMAEACLSFLAIVSRLLLFQQAQHEHPGRGADQDGRGIAQGGRA